MNGAGCVEDDQYAHSKTCLARNPTIRDFFDHRHPANHLGARQCERDPHAYATPWYHQLYDPNFPKMALALPEPPVDYTQSRIRSRSLIVEHSFSIEQLMVAEPARFRLLLSPALIHKLFVTCGVPHHQHKVALLQVELTAFRTSGVITNQLLYATLDMKSPAPDPLPTDVNALTERSWFHHNDYHVRNDSEEMTSYSCRLLCNSDHSGHQPISLYHDTWGTGLSTFVYYEALNRGYEGMHVSETAQGQVLVELPNAQNVSRNPMSVWMLDYFKTHRLGPPLMDKERKHALLEKHIYADICKELTIKTRKGSCMLEHEVTLELTLLHPEEWKQAFARATNKDKRLTFVSTLNLVGVVLGY